MGLCSVLESFHGEAGIGSSYQTRSFPSVFFPCFRCFQRQIAETDFLRKKMKELTGGVDFNVR